MPPLRSGYSGCFSAGFEHAVPDLACPLFSSAQFGYNGEGRLTRLWRTPSLTPDLQAIILLLVEIIEMEPPKRLLIMACSQRKRPDPGLLPAMERYDGPQFQVLRKFLHEQPVEVQSVDTFILSANFGLISANQPIPNYDCKMSPQRAHELQPKVICKFEQILQINHYSELFINLGQKYGQALVGYEKLMSAEIKITIAQGSQGGRQAALRRWLYNGLVEQSYGHSVIATQGKALIRGIEITLTSEKVFELARQALAEGHGDPAGYQSAYVLVDGQRVAPKWLVSQLTGLPVGSFHTGDARRVLQQLGIEVYSTGGRQ